MKRQTMFVSNAQMGCKAFKKQTFKSNQEYIKKYLFLYTYNKLSQKKLK